MRQKRISHDFFRRKRTMSPPKKAGFNFEEALEELESLVTSMEEGDLSLEESLQAFEKGIKLTRECQTALKQAEQKVQVLLNQSGDTEDLETGELED
jgi:exodeoxyribonuclease VII small subunit